MSAPMWMFSVRYAQYDRSWPIAVFDDLEDGKAYGQGRARAHFQHTEPLIWDDDNADGDYAALVLRDGARYVEYQLLLISRNPDPVLAFGLSRPEVTE